MLWPNGSGVPQASHSSHPKPVPAGESHVWFPQQRAFRVAQVDDRTSPILLNNS